jgi:hypothetical protein
MTISAYTIALLIDAGLSNEKLKAIAAAIDDDVKHACNMLRKQLREHVTLGDAGSVTPAALRMRKMRENKRLLANPPPSEQTVTERNAVTSQSVTSYNILKEESKGIEEVSKEESKPVVIARGPRKIDYSEKFEQKFWASYPRDSGMSKSEAWKVWRKMPEADQDKAIAAIPGFIKWVAAQGATYRVVHACRYLSQRRFDGWSGSDGRQSGGLSNAERQEALRILRE